MWTVTESRMAGGYGPGSGLGADDFGAGRELQPAVRDLRVEDLADLSEQPVGEMLVGGGTDRAADRSDALAHLDEPVDRFLRLVDEVIHRRNVDVGEAGPGEQAIDDVGVRE